MQATYLYVGGGEMFFTADTEGTNGGGTVHALFLLD